MSAASTIPIPFGDAKLDVSFAPIETNAKTQGAHCDLDYGNGLSPYTVFEGPRGFVKFGVKPSSTDKFKQPDQTNKDFAKERFTFEVSLNSKDPKHQAFARNGDEIDAAVRAAVRANPDAFVKLGAAERAMANEVRDAIVMSKHFKWVKEGNLKNLQKPEEGKWPDSYDVKLDGWAPCAVEYLYKMVKTEQGMKEMVGSVVWAVREVGVVGAPSPLPDAAKLILVWKTDILADGSEYYHTTDVVPMMDENGTILTKVENGQTVPRMRYVGPQDMAQPGVRALPLFGASRMWTSSTGYGVSKTVKSAVYIWPALPKNSARLQAAKRTKLDAVNVAAIAAAMMAGGAGAAEDDDDPAVYEAPPEAEDEYAAAAAVAAVAAVAPSVDDDDAAAMAAANEAEAAIAAAAKKAAKAAKAPKEPKSSGASKKRERDADE